MTITYIAREWKCHAATSVGYEAAGQFHQVAECSGFGNTSEEAQAMAARIARALNQAPDSPSCTRELGDIAVSATRIDHLMDLVINAIDAHEDTKVEALTVAVQLMARRAGWLSEVVAARLGEPLRYQGTDLADWLQEDCVCTAAQGGGDAALETSGDHRGCE